MLQPVLKRILSVFQLNSFGSSSPWAIPNPKMDFEDSPMTRQRLNELLQQTPSIPSQEAKEPVQLS